MNNLKKFFTLEPILFYGVLLVNVLLLFFVRFLPSMDGPAHLYNSQLITALLTNQGGTLTDYFVLNSFPVPNWIGHFIIASLMFLFPAWLAEKFFLTVYIIGMAVSFRLLIKKVNPENSLLSFLIFPFIYSFLFHLGFYNYSFSFIFLFFTLYYWLHSAENKGFIKYLLLVFLFLGAFFSNILTYLFLGLSIGLMIIVQQIKNNLHVPVGIILKSILKKWGILLLITLPSLILFVLFYQLTSFSASNEGYPMSELTQWIFDVKALIVYNYQIEKKFTQVFIYLFLFIFIVSFYFRYKKRSSNGITDFLQWGDLFLLPLFLSLVLFYIVPNHSGAGMMSDRYCLMIFMLMLLWVAFQKTPKIISWFVVFAAFMLHIGLLVRHYNTLFQLSADAIEIEKTAIYIEPESVVLPVNLSDNWLEGHFSNYLGINKPLVILENYEASVGWFPVKWNHEIMPKTLLGDKNSVTGIYWPSGVSSKSPIVIDYVFLYGQTSKIDNPEKQELKQILTDNYQLIYSSDKDFTSLYKLKVD